MTSSAITELVEAELSRISNSAMVAAIRGHLVAPYPVDRAWDYRRHGERFTCWTVLEHPPSNTGISYCEAGFGPTHPWGLVFLSGECMSIGSDVSWYGTLEEAMQESAAWDPPFPSTPS